MTAPPESLEETVQGIIDEWDTIPAKDWSFVLMETLAEVKLRLAEARELASRVAASSPYVKATLPYPGQESTSGVTCTHPEWSAVHKGRAGSSTQQLEAMENQAKALQKALAQRK